MQHNPVLSLPIKIKRLIDRIKPSGVYGYHDKVTTWIKCPLSDSERAWLQRLCGGRIDTRYPGEIVRTHKTGQWNRHPVFFPDKAYRQRIQLCQPQEQALEWLVERDDVRFTYLEEALDWTFDDPSLVEAYEFACTYHVKKYHRDQGIRFVKTTRYSGPRSAPNVLATYPDRPSKVTGEIDCLHFCWRIKGHAALKRAGFPTLADLIRIDRRAFWQNRLFFQFFDMEALGRRYNNYRLGSNRRKPWITRYGRNGRFAINRDSRQGNMLWFIRGSTQAIIDEYRDKFDINSCLIPIPVDHLLLEADNTLFYDYLNSSPFSFASHSLFNKNPPFSTNASKGDVLHLPSISTKRSTRSVPTQIVPTSPRSSFSTGAASEPR